MLLNQVQINKKVKYIPKLEDIIKLMEELDPNEPELNLFRNYLFYIHPTCDK